MHLYKTSNSLMKDIDVDSVFIQDAMSTKDWAKLEFIVRIDKTFTPKGLTTILLRMQNKL